MKRNDELRQSALATVIFKHIAAYEFKSRKAERPGDRRAVFDNIRLQINSRHAHAPAAQNGKIVVNRKRKIAFSAAKIAYAQLAFGGQTALDLPDMLKKATYLTELRLFFVVNSAAFVAYAERAQKRLATVKQTVLAAVIPRRSRLARGGIAERGSNGARAHNGGIPLRIGAIFASGSALKHKIGAHKTCRKSAERLRIVLRNIPLQRLAVLHKRLKLYHAPAAHGDGTRTGVLCGTVTRHRKAAFFYDPLRRRLAYKPRKAQTLAHRREIALVYTHFFFFPYVDFFFTVRCGFAAGASSSAPSSSSAADRPRSSS